MRAALATRDRAAREIMDDPDCDAEMLENTYRQFAIVKALLSRTKPV